MKKLACILIVIISLTGCQKCKKKQPLVNPEVQPLSNSYQVFKDMFYFKAGSYWIYQDSLHPSMLDSVWVYYAGINYDTIKVTENCVNAGIYEIFGTYTKSSLRPSVLTLDVENFVCHDWVQYSCAADGKLLLYDNDPPHGSTFMTSWFIPGVVFYSQIPSGTSWFGGSSKFINKYTSITAGINSFSDVCEVNHEGYKSSDGTTIHYQWRYNTNYYIANKIGIVKKVELDSNRVWNLVRYNVLQ